MKKIVTRVLGVGNKNVDGSSRQKILQKFAKKGDVVVLKHVSSSDGDLSTVEVLLTDEEKKQHYRVGFLPGRIGGMLAKYLDSDQEVTAVISSLSKDEESQHTGVHLRITY